MDVAPAVFIILNNAYTLLCAPFLDDRARQEGDAWGDKIIEKEIAGAGPCSPTLRPDKMNKEVRHLCKEDDERLGPPVVQHAPNQSPRISVKPRITPVWLIDGQIHPACRF